MKALKRWYGNLKIRNKIIIVFLPMIFLPLIFIAYISNSILTQNIIKKTVVNISDNSQLIIAGIENTLQNAESCANMLTINISKDILQSRGEEFRDLNLYNRINTGISKAMVVFRDVESVAFIDTDYKIYTQSVPLDNSPKATSFYLMLDAINKTNGINCWFPMEVRDFLVTRKDKPYLTLGKSIIDLYTGDKLGTLVINVSESTFSDMFRNLNNRKNSTYFIVDQKNVIVSSSNSSELLTQIQDGNLLHLLSEKREFNELISFKQEKMLITCRAIEGIGWKLLTVTPVSELTQDSRSITKLIIVLSILSLLFAVVSAGYLSNIISFPIITLKQSMLEIERGNLDAAIKAYSEDEIGLLAKGFKKMIARIKELIESVDQEQKKKREYELALINAQIKPHFLYNTLETAYILAEMGRTDEVKKTIKSLGDFYRIALSKGKEFITIREELKNIQAYLYIQAMRYSDVFDYEVTAESLILDYKIIKMTLQPLVENAIYHGLKLKQGYGHLKVEAHEDGRLIEIKITDNGAGMDHEKIDKVLSRRTQGSPDSFGLYCVNERIKLYYGDAYGISICSEPGRGTEVTIRIPKLVLQEEAI